MLSSAKKQVILFDEILLYNDCSTDDTVTVAEKFGAKVINGDINRGCSWGKNKLAALTNCEWIHFHDADDDLLPMFTTHIHNWINNFGDIYQILLLNFNYVDAESGNLLGRANHDVNALHDDPLKYTINHKVVNFAVYKRQPFLKAGGFDLDENVLYNEDNAVHQRLAKNNLKFDYLHEITCINYRHAKSMSASNQLKCARANYQVIEKTAETHGNVYAIELSMQLWHCAAILAALQDWVYVQKSLLLSKKLGYRYSPQGSSIFKWMTMISPYTSVWLREKLIRLFKPNLRKN